MFRDAFTQKAQNEIELQHQLICALCGLGMWTWRGRAARASVDAVPARSKNNQFGMVDAKVLRYVAIPTNRRVRFQHVAQVIQLNCIPGQQVSIR
jgi:hypothetical protein